jgi:hypothetical protein
MNYKYMIIFGKSIYYNQILYNKKTIMIKQFSLGD